MQIYLPAADTSTAANDLSIYDEIAATWMDDTNAAMPADETVAVEDANLVAFAADTQSSGSRRSWSGFWDGVQGTLDVGGLYPAAGIVPDGINTVISLGRRRWGEAGMNLSAMVPIFGQFSKGGQLLNKGRKALNKAETVKGTAKTIKKIDYSKIPDHPSVGPGKSFTQTKKKNILEQNKQQNGGTLKSDQSGTELVPGQQHKKGIAPPANEAHVDHIVPKSKGGANSSANAQVLSREENLRKSNK